MLGENKDMEPAKSMFNGNKTSIEEDRKEEGKEDRKEREDDREGGEKRPTKKNKALVQQLKTTAGKTEG